MRLFSIGLITAALLVSAGCAKDKKASSDTQGGQAKSMHAMAGMMGDHGGHDHGMHGHSMHGMMGDHGMAHAGKVSVPKEGKKFAPPVQKAQLPGGVWYCDMGTVHYARGEKGDGTCPLCKMKLKQLAEK